MGSMVPLVRYSRSISAKIFIEFIALIVRNRIYNLLRENMLRIDAKYNYLTVPAAVRELEKIEMVRRNGGNYRPDHAVAKTQKVIRSVLTKTVSPEELTAGHQPVTHEQRGA